MGESTRLGTVSRWFKARTHRVVIAGVGIATCLIFTFLLLNFFVIPEVVREMVVQQSALTDGSRMMDKWKEPKYKMQFKVWVYSVRNPDDVLNGAVPELRSSGPYVFDKTIKHEVLKSGGGSVTFKRRTVYHFNEEDSCPTCILGNRVWIPNIIYQKFTEIASRPAMKAAATSLIAQTPFLEVEVGDLLFHGYKDPFLENFCDVPFVNVVCQTIFSMPERIGLFYGFNNSYSEGEYTIKDGTGDIKDRATITSFNGMPHLRETWWRTKEARVLRGSEGTLFHPFVDAAETLWTFSSQLCRSLALKFKELTSYREVPLLRFTVPPEQFDTSTPEMAGFCHPMEKIFYAAQNMTEHHCYPRGLVPVSKCQPNEPPVVISLPNFLYANDEVRQSVKGLNETDEERDAITVDIEPTLGLAFRARRRAQLNAEFWSGKDILIPTFHRKQRSTLIPLVVVHDDADIDDDTYNMVKSELILSQKLAYGACSFLAFSALICLIATAVYALVQSGLISCCRRDAVHVPRGNSAGSTSALFQSIVPGILRSRSSTTSSSDCGADSTVSSDIRPPVPQGYI